MKFLKTHTGAMVVLAVVIVLSVLLGSHRSLVQAREKVEAQFAPIAGDLDVYKRQRLDLSFERSKARRRLCR